MQTKTIYEEKILRELRDLPEIVQERLSNIMHTLKKEIMILEGDERRSTDEFLSVCGTWEDNKSAEEQIKAIYSSRRFVGTRFMSDKILSSIERRTKCPLSRNKQ